MTDLIPISWSEIDAYHQCPHKWWLGYIEGWQAPPSPALQRGIDWHELMDLHYAGRLPGGDPRQASAKVSELLGRTDPHATEQQGLLTWMFDGYGQMWDEEDHRDWTVVASEHKLELPLPDPEGNPSRFLVRARIDLLARFKPNGKLWLWDHKTGANLPKGKDLDFEDQFGLYIWLLRQTGHEIQGCVYNAARTQRNKSAPQPLNERFSRTLLVRTDTELRTMANEIWATAEAMYPLDQPPLWPPPRHPDSERCKWRCGFTEGCLASRKGMKVDSYMEAHGLERRHGKPILWRSEVDVT